MATSVGIFDSGVGGLTVSEALHRLAPALPQRYFADTACFPYGGRSDGVVAARALTLARRLVDEGCSLRLRDELDVPIVGMEPPLKPAAARSRSGRVAVLVTAATARGSRLARLHDDHANGVDIETVPMPGLADLVESGEIRGDAVERTLREGLDGPLSRGVDQVALGCTHYGFLLPVLRGLLAESVDVLHAAEPVARRTVDRLEANGTPPPSSGRPEAVRCSATGDPDAFVLTIKRLRAAGAALPPIELLPREDEKR
jgi:glutamate racemase